MRSDKLVGPIRQQLCWKSTEEMMDKITIQATIQPGRPVRITLSLTVLPNATSSALDELIVHAQQLMSGSNFHNPYEDGR